MEPPKEFIPVLGYDWLTWLYDIMIKLTMPERKFRTELVRRVDTKKAELILEFGYGTGSNSVLAINENPETIFKGLDIDQKIRKWALQKLKKCNLSIDLDLYDGGKFPYPDNAFDKVYSCLVFHQLDATTKAHCFREIYRVLKPGREVIIADWGKAKSKLMKVSFYAVQLLDGFHTIKDNVKGLLPDYIKKAGFINVSETGHINTLIGSFSYYQGNK